MLPYPTLLSSSGLLSPLFLSHSLLIPLPLFCLSLNPIHWSWVTNLIGVQRRSSGKPDMKQKKTLSSAKKHARQRDRDSDGQSNRPEGERQSKEIESERSLCESLSLHVWAYKKNRNDSLEVSDTLLRADIQIPDVRFVPVEAISQPNFGFVVDCLDLLEKHHHQWQMLISTA